MSVADDARRLIDTSAPARISTPRQPADLHPRISLSGLSFPKTTSLRDDLTLLSAAGIKRIGVHRDKLTETGWEAGLDLLTGDHVIVAYLVHRSMYSLCEPHAWEEQSASVEQTIDAASRLGASLVYATTGPAIGVSWSQALTALSQALPSVLEHCQERRVRLAVETANPQFADIHFLHTLRDTVEAALATGLGVCFDTYTCWTERHLEQTIRRGAEAIELVQVNDYVPGSRGLDWAVPGDGVIPLQRILSWLLDSGYSGYFDLKLRATAPESDIDTILRGAERLGALLERLGV